ncbi:GPO family capsid scaffolding protein [Aeromonas hydrophila]|uniref:GPO family capsid scaffolding protein n=1 Tax=Aeromonas hydrophila TaxID=644 RepID=UPI00080B5890|nr:GPO family capsid scaffolding protein [Aeromonas hydrophila]
MSSQVKTGWICIASAGPTLDGRTISPECLRQLAETYDPNFYVANLWPEGVRGRPLGHVYAVKVQEQGDQLKLLAVLCPTLELIDLNTSGTHAFCTIEASENFASTGKWYLSGVTVTDQPTLTGLTQLQFSAKPPSGRPLVVPVPAPAVPAPSPSKPAFRTSKPEQMFSQIEALSAGVTALCQKLDSFTPYRPNQPSAADRSDDSTHANHHRIY